MILQNLDNVPLALVEEYTTAFHRAEEALKTAEQTIVFLPSVANTDNGGLFAPAINELRYAGKHFVDFVETGDIEFINKGIAHCLRAEFDSYDCLIQFLLSECRDFQNDYRHLCIIDVLPDYPNMIKDVYRISRNPITRDKVRSDALEAKKSECDRMSEICAVLSASRSELNKLKQKQLSSCIFKFAGWIIAVIISILSLFK